MRILIQNAMVLPVQDGQDVLHGVDVAVEDGRITGVDRQLPASLPAHATLDGTDHLVVPGLVNAHVHSHNNYWRGLQPQPERGGQSLVGSRGGPAGRHPPRT
jgi:5-methylthioadenosine/S-adenosylhomocysteine deaminase